jgi:excisionase family DNA binding protein
MASNAVNWLTVEQAAKQSGYNEQYIRRLCRDGKLVFDRIGGSYLIDPDSLKEYTGKMKSLGTDKYNWRRD